MAGFRDSIVEISEAALLKNLEHFKGLIHKSSHLILVLKANSYGAGAIPVARLFENEERVEYYAVASIDEGIELRKAQIKKPIIILSPDADRFKEVLSNKLQPVITSPSNLKSCIRQLGSITNYPVHLNFDTGMHRVGFRSNEVNALIQLLHATNCIKIETVFSHYSGSGSAKFDAFTMEQAEEFNTMFSELTAHLDYQPKTHLNNSGGLERFNNDMNALHRLGVGLYGHSVEKSALQNVFAWKTKVAHIQWVEKGESVSYNRSWIAPKRSKIATVFVGYADGLNRRLSNGKWHLKSGNHALPIVGDICMDLCMVDATTVELEVGQELIILNTAKDIENMAETLGTISYEIQTSISSRVERSYV